MTTFTSLQSFRNSYIQAMKDNVLNICAVTKRKGIYNKDIRPAIVTMEDGSIHRILVYKNVKKGRRYNGDKIAKINRRARAKAYIQNGYVVVVVTEIVK